MTKTRLFLAGAGTSLIASLIASPALAHEGEHSASFMLTIMHWLSSPTHALFACIGGITAGIVISKIIKNRKA